MNKLEKQIIDLLNYGYSIDELEERLQKKK